MKKIKKILLSEYVLIFVFLLVSTRFLFLLQPNGPFFRIIGDAAAKVVWYPAIVMIRNLWPSGFSFLWSPLFGAGIPFIADPALSGVIPYRFLMAIDPGLYVVLILMTAGYFSYLFARTVRIGVGGSLLAAIGYMFNAYFFQYLNHSQLEADALLPALLLCFTLIVKTGNLTFVVLAAVSLSASILVMSPESTFYSIFLIVVLIPTVKISDWYSNGRKVSELTRGVGLVFCAIIAGVLLASFQVLPFTEYMQGHALLAHLQRGLRHNSLSDLFSVISSDYYFKFNWLYTPFVGARAIAFFFLIGVYSAFAKIDRYKSAFLISLFLVVGIGYGYLTKLFNYLPLFGVMANEKHTMPAIAFCVAIIGGFGLDHLLKNISKRSFRIFLVCAVIGGAGFELLSFYKYLPACAGFADIAWRTPPSYAEFLKKDNEVFRVYANPIDGSTEGKIYGMVRGNNVEVFNINNVSYELIYFPYRYSKYITELVKGRYDYTHCILESSETFKSPLFDLLNIKYVAGQYVPDLEKIDKDKFTLVHRQAEGMGGQGPLEVAIYRNNKVMSRAFMVFNARYLTSEKDILAAMSAPDFDPRAVIVVESASPVVMSSGSAIPSESSVTMVSYAPKEVTIKVTASNDGFLLLGDVYYPGWKAFEGNDEHKIYRSDYLFRSIFLKAGAHNVRFVYEPQAFRTGIMISCAAVLICVLMLLYQKGFMPRKVALIGGVVILVFILTNIISFYSYFYHTRDPFVAGMTKK